MYLLELDILICNPEVSEAYLKMFILPSLKAGMAYISQRDALRLLHLSKNMRIHVSTSQWVTRTCCTLRLTPDNWH